MDQRIHHLLHSRVTLPALTWVLLNEQLNPPELKPTDHAIRCGSGQ